MKKLFDEGSVSKNRNSILERIERMRVLEVFIDILWSLDTDFRFIYASPTVEKLLGFSQDEIIGKSIEMLTTSESFALIKKAFHEVSTLNTHDGVHEVPFAFKIELKHRDGNSVWFEILQVILKNESHTPIGMVVVAKDVSNQVQALKDLEESEAKYRALIEQSVLGITIATGSPLKLVYVNDTIEKMLGYNKSEMISWGPKEISELVHPEDRAAFFERFQNRIEGKPVPASFEFRAVRKTGEIVWFEVHGARIEYESNTAVIAIFIEITKRRLAQKEAYESNKFSEFLIDLMGHDLNNIHQGMMTGLELILLRGDIQQENVTLLESIMSQLQRADNLISRVRTLSNVRFERLQQTPIDIHDPISKALSSVKSTFPNKTILANSNFSPSKYFVQGGEFLTDVFYNIFHNSAKYDEKDPVILDINIVSSANESLQLVVEDRAVGIPDSKKTSILRRLDDKGKTHSGIGLTLAKEIIDRYNGRIWIEDRITGDYSKGCRFVIILQLCKDPIK